MILCDNQCLELVFKDKESELYFPTIFEAPKLVHAKFFLYWLIFLYKKKGSSKVLEDNFKLWIQFLQVVHFIKDKYTT